MIPSQRQAGWALLSRCLAIALSGAVVVGFIWTFRQWQNQKRQAQIKQDIAQVFALASSYYHAVGCFPPKEGVATFAGSLKPSWEQIQSVTGASDAIPANRMPWVQTYDMRIYTIPSEAGGVGYGIEVGADLTQSAWPHAHALQQALGAQRLDAHRLVWSHPLHAVRSLLGHAYRPRRLNRQRLAHSNFNSNATSAWYCDTRLKTQHQRAA